MHPRQDQSVAEGARFSDVSDVPKAVVYILAYCGANCPGNGTPYRRDFEEKMCFMIF